MSEVESSSGPLSFSVIVPHFEAPDDLQQCVAHLVETSDPRAADSFEILVVDNASTTPRSRTALQQCTELASSVGAVSLKVLDQEQNLGFATACNRGAQVANSERLLLLNPDARITAENAAALCRSLDPQQRLGAVGCRIEAEDRCAEPSWAPDLTFFTELRRRRFWRAWERRVPWAVERAEARQSRARDVPWLTAACLAVHARAFEEISGFDERYFLYYEDADLGRRLRAAGWRLRYQPQPKAIHRRGTATSGRSDLQQIRRASQRLYYRTWNSWFDRLLLGAYHLVASGRRSAP